MKLLTLKKISTRKMGNTSIAKINQTQSRDYKWGNLVYSCNVNALKKTNNSEFRYSKLK